MCKCVSYPRVSDETRFTSTSSRTPSLTRSCLISFTPGWSRPSTSTSTMQMSSRFVVLHIVLICDGFCVVYKKSLCVFVSLRCPGSRTNITLVSTVWWNWCWPRLCPRICRRSSYWTRTSRLPPISLSCGSSSTSLKVLFSSEGNGQVSQETEINLEKITELWTKVDRIHRFCRIAVAIKSLKIPFQIFSYIASHLA